MTIPAADLLAAIRASVKAVFDTFPHRYVDGVQVITADYNEAVARHAAQAALNVMAEHADLEPCDRIARKVLP